MIDQAAVILWALLIVGSTPSKAESLDSEVAIGRCAAVAEMLASAYVAYPDDVQLRTDLIVKEKRKLEDRLGVTDRHVMSAITAPITYDAKRLSGRIPKSGPINGVHIAAEGAARCMARTFDRSAA